MSVNKNCIDLLKEKSKRVLTDLAGKLTRGKVVKIWRKKKNYMGRSK